MTVQRGQLENNGLSLVGGLDIKCRPLGSGFTPGCGRTMGNLGKGSIDNGIGHEAKGAVKEK
jgi:hypothetical protein